MSQTRGLRQCSRAVVPSLFPCCKTIAVLPSRSISAVLPRWFFSAKKYLPDANWQSTYRNFITDIGRQCRSGADDFTENFRQAWRISCVLQQTTLHLLLIVKKMECSALYSVDSELMNNYFLLNTDSAIMCVKCILDLWPCQFCLQFCIKWTFDLPESWQTVV